MSVRTAPPEFKNFAELLDRLGRVPPERIRLQPAPGSATVEDVVEIEAKEDRLCELVDGVLVEKPMGYTESNIAIKLITALQLFVEKGDLGVVTGEAGMIRMSRDLVRIPDVAFASWDRFPARKLPDESVPEIVPDLAVDVLSKNNTPREMELKLREYFAAGVKLVWIVDPAAKTVTVYSAPTRAKTLSASQTLDGGKVLPGFELSIRKIFANLGSQRKKRT
jgi:Uma2 family endonuclease